MNDSVSPLSPSTGSSSEGVEEEGGVGGVSSVFEWEDR